MANDLWPCYDRFSSQHPERETQTLELLQLCLNPVADEDRLKSAREGLEEAKKSSAGYVATMMRRSTVRSVKFVRWLRNLNYSETGWGDATR